MDASRYTEAFDAAIEASRHHDMPPALRDRRAGVIETDPALSGSILEPWRPNATVGLAVENTIAFQRRRARFEFTRSGVEAEPGDAVPDLLAVRTPPIDLTAWTGPLELRVEVVIERAYTPGIRRGTWSRANTTQSTVRRPAADPDAPTERFWTAVARDPAFERRLLAEVEAALLAAPPAGD